MSLLTTLRAMVCNDIACAKPASCARQADRLAIAPFRPQQHVLVEHFFLEHLVASVAVQSLSVSLAVNAGICFLLKFKRAEIARVWVLRGKKVLRDWRLAL